MYIPEILIEVSPNPAYLLHRFIYNYIHIQIRKHTTLNYHHNFDLTFPSSFLYTRSFSSKNRITSFAMTSLPSTINQWPIPSIFTVRRSGTNLCIFSTCLCEQEGSSVPQKKRTGMWDGMLDGKGVGVSVFVSVNMGGCMRSRVSGTEDENENEDLTSLFFIPKLINTIIRKRRVHSILPKLFQIIFPFLSHQRQPFIYLKIIIIRR